MVRPSLRLPRRAVAAGLLLSGALMAGGAQAAKSDGCAGGGFAVLGRSGQQDTTVAAGQLDGPTFLVSGRYVQFEVDQATLGALNYTLTGAPNSEDITGGMRTPVFASKLPEHRGLTLAGPLFL